MNKALVVAAILVLFGGGVYYLTSVYDPWDRDGDGVVCTADAMQCPDGSYVGRTGPNCEFVCPSDGSVGEFWGSIIGSVLLGPTCPVEQYPPDPECADKPYATTLVVTTPDGARVIKTFASNTEGKFNVEVPPGQYAIRSAAAANVLPYCSTNEEIVVEANGYAEVTVSCDTGIR